MDESYIRLKVVACRLSQKVKVPERRKCEIFEVRNRLFHSVVRAAVTALTLSPVMFSQTAQPSVATRTPMASAKHFDPHDLSGIWVRGKVPKGNAPLSANRPPFTPWGQAKFNTVKGSWSYSKAPGLAPPIAPEKEWNDPILQCEPAGYPRVMLQIYAPLMRFIQTSNEVVEFFEWGHTFRDIWTDGRKPLDTPEPTYYGYSVGRWDGYTFVVDSNGFTDRTWTDPLGSPHSDQMTLHEVFRRVDHDHLELVITLTDPKTYTKPWVSDTMLFDWAPKSPRSENEEFREDFCIYSEQSSFFKDVDPVGASDAPVKNKIQ
jgi:hypothetical protein